MKSARTAMPRKSDCHDASAGRRCAAQEHRADRARVGQTTDRLCSPVWEFSPITNELLLKHGFSYDHSLMHNDFHPYYVRVGDRWTTIDYAKPAAEWMKPLQRGQETDLVEIPASWYLDDLPPMMFIKKSANSHGFVNPHDIEQLWRDQFDWVYREHGLCRVCDDHPSGCERPPAGLADARAADRIHQRPRRGELVYAGRDCGGFCPAPAQGLSRLNPGV